MDLVGRTSSSRGDPDIIRLGVSREDLVLTSDRIVPATARYSCLGEYLSGFYQREQSKSSSFEINMVSRYALSTRLIVFEKCPIGLWSGKGIFGKDWHPYNDHQPQK